LCFAWQRYHFHIYLLLMSTPLYSYSLINEVEMGVIEDIGDNFLTGGEEGEGVVEIFLGSGEGGQDFGEDGAGGEIDFGEHGVGFPMGLIEDELGLSLSVGEEAIEVRAAGVEGVGI